VETEATGAAGPQLSAGLQQAAARWNAEAPHSYTPQSTLSQWKMSGNGMSQNDAQRMLPGLNSEQFPTSNGASASTLESQNNLRMAGGLPL
jgi:hypothetical protein